MLLAAQPAEPTGRINRTDVRPDRLEGSEGSALGFDFSEDVFADADTEVGCGAGEPATLFLQEVGGHALGFVGEVDFVAAGFVELVDCLVDFFAADRGGDFEAVGGGEFGAGCGLRR